MKDAENPEVLLAALKAARTVLQEAELTVRYLETLKHRTIDLPATLHRAARSVGEASPD